MLKHNLSGYPRKYRYAPKMQATSTKARRPLPASPSFRASCRRSSAVAVPKVRPLILRIRGGFGQVTYHHHHDHRNHRDQDAEVLEVDVVDDPEKRALARSPCVEADQPNVTGVSTAMRKMPRMKPTTIAQSSPWR